MRCLSLSTLVVYGVFMSALFALGACEDPDSLDPAGNERFASGNYAADGFTGSGSPVAPPGPGGNSVDTIAENDFVEAASEPISTFSIDADGGSYAVTKRLVETGQDFDWYRPAIRTEEFVNYFDLDYDLPAADAPIAFDGEVSTCPWAPDHRLVRLGIEGRRIPEAELPPSNFVFLVDVSGSMGGEDRLELLKRGFTELARTLTAEDRVAIVTYSGTTAIALPPTPGNDFGRISTALAQLESGGSTAGGQAIVDAYALAEEAFVDGGNNRLIMATDGDFNVGISDRDELVELIENKRDAGIYLTTVGVGLGNYQEAALEQIANHGNGTYEYVADVDDVLKVFVHERARFFAVAKDVKVQIEFDPSQVAYYRLIGYENRLLQTEDFDDDTKDAGEIGAGQSVTALYEVVPTRAGRLASRNNPTRPYTFDVRYKLPDSDASQLLQTVVEDRGVPFAQASDHQQFVAGVAAFALVTRESAFVGDADYGDVAEWLALAQLPDEHRYKAELRQLVGRME